MKYACIGEHLPHSFSKEIHAELGDYEYELRELGREELDAFARGADFKAINVTIPYKEQIIPYLAEIDEGARAIGAVNTVVNRGGKLCGYNTDLYGMMKLFEHAGVEARGKRAAILGTGGTAKTARAALTALGAREIATVSRTAKGGAMSYEELAEKSREVEIIVNTTPCGMFPRAGEMPPIELDRFEKLEGVIDAVYNPLRTRLVAEARRRGIRAEGGLYMLVAQAVRASEIFFDKRYPTGELERVYKKIFFRKENPVLTGMPSSGKSTLGKALAKRLGRPFLDTDAMIEEAAGCKISEIFARDGEARFRELEREAVAKAALVTGAVVATGGGAVLDARNVAALKMNGRIIFLDRAPEELTPTADRPLALDKEALMRRYEEREPIYRAAADMTLTVKGTPEELAEKIVEELTK